MKELFDGLDKQTGMGKARALPRKVDYTAIWQRLPGEAFHSGKQASCSGLTRRCSDFVPTGHRCCLKVV
jgi:hypothetical protein